MIAELRLARPTAAPIVRLAGPDQRRLIDDVLGRLKVPVGDVPAVCLLDTGVNRGHPLLTPGLDAADTQAVDPAWGTNDHHGHGTKMAGLALYGDLTPIVTSADAIGLQTRLESVKLLPPSGENWPELYGALTAQAIARAEIQAAQRRRAVCLTATVADYRDLGQPSSWSAEIDALCSGVPDEHRRLLFAAAGNVPFELYDGYAESNVTTSVHDPGQSWNAVTIGVLHRQGAAR